MALLILLIELLIFGLLALVAYLGYIEYRHYTYFTKRGMPYSFSNFLRTFKFLSGNMTIVDAELELYKETKVTPTRYAGYTDGLTMKGIYVTDLDLTRNIYVKDFDHFVNRRRFTSTKGDLLFHKMIVMMEDEYWKGMRNKLSPTFTTGKIRKMFQIFGRSSERMCDYIKRRVGPSGGDLDLMESYSKYAMDAIASCVFGVDSKSFECDPGKLSEFEEMGQLLQFKFKGSNFIKFLIVMASPKLADFLGLKPLDLTPQIYFRNVIRQVLKHRRETGERQDDFLQLMMDIQKGMLKENEEESKETLEVMTGSKEGDAKKFGEGGAESVKLTFDDDDIAANCVLFLLAGYDTLQSLLIWTAYTLALEQDVQKKLFKEVRDTMEKNGGKLTYDGVHEMKYLDMVINETLRMYPPAARTERLCTRDYNIPGTDKVIEKGVLVSLSVMGMHRDPEVYENPGKFDPERFLPEKKAERHPYAFAPFGHGPRNCIGMRFALTEVKAVICHLVNGFQLEPCGKTEIPAKFGNTSSLRPANGMMWLKAKPRLVH